MKKVFTNHQVICITRQPKSLKNYFVRSRFDFLGNPPELNYRENNGMFCCTFCIYCKDGFFKPCNQIVFGQRQEFKWEYTRKFNCNSINLIYLLKCNNCWEFYIGQTENIKQRVNKHKSDIFHPENSFCKKCSNHLRNHSNFVVPFFQIYPIYYEDNTAKRRFIVKRFVLRYKPPLNTDK